MHSHSLFLKIRFFLLIRRRELSNSISLQKCFHQIKIPFRLNDKAHMTARNCADLRIQFPEQICEPFLIFLFENVIFREEDQYPPPQIFKIICLERRVILQHIYTPEAWMHFLQKTQTIQQLLSSCEVRRVLFLIHRSRDAPADKTLCFFFLHFLRFLCIYFMVFMQKSQWSFPRPSVMLLSQISFGCRPV